MSRPLSLLIIEDEPLIAMMLEDFVDGLGHRVVAVIDNLDDALAAVDRGGFEAAIMDVRLRGGVASWPVADRLAAAGVPFMVATGGHVEPPPHEHANVPHLMKPFTMEGVRRALDDLGAMAEER